MNTLDKKRVSYRTDYLLFAQERSDESDNAMNGVNSAILLFCTLTKKIGEEREQKALFQVLVIRDPNSRSFSLLIMLFLI